MRVRVYPTIDEHHARDGLKVLARAKYVLQMVGRVFRLLIRLPKQIDDALAALVNHKLSAELEILREIGFECSSHVLPAWSNGTVDLATLSERPHPHFARYCRGCCLLQRSGLGVLPN